jgi:hypothetical protein
LKTDKPFTENDYQEALYSLGIRFDASPETPEYAELKKLYAVIENLETILESHSEPVLISTVVA